MNLYVLIVNKIAQVGVSIEKGTTTKIEPLKIIETPAIETSNLQDFSRRQIVCQRN